jgi:GPI ethanolamine phosphate transferase 1
MLCVGFLYLLFEESILVSSKSGSLAARQASGLSRSILGAQVGLIVLAMVVTRSSIESLQAKRGLPTGNQLVGWLVLGRPEAKRIQEIFHSSG